MEPTAMSGRMMMKGPAMAKEPEDEELKEKADYKVTFTPPASYTLPEGAQPGETFDAAAKLRIEPDGKLCLLTLDGVPMEEGEQVEEEEEVETRPPTLEEAVAAHKAAGQPM